MASSFYLNEIQVSSCIVTLNYRFLLEYNYYLKESDVWYEYECIRINHLSDWLGQGCQLFSHIFPICWTTHLHSISIYNKCKYIRFCSISCSSNADFKSRQECGMWEKCVHLCLIQVTSAIVFWSWSFWLMSDVKHLIFFSWGNCRRL